MPYRHIWPRIGGATFDDTDGRYFIRSQLIFGPAISHTPGSFAYFAWRDLGVAVLCFALLGFAPGLFDAIARELNIIYGPTLAISLAIAALVIKALLLDIECSKLRVKNQRLAQKLAMLESDLADHRNATNKATSSLG